MKDFAIESFSVIVGFHLGFKLSIERSGVHSDRPAND
jgi:hypothetical protein